MKRVMSTLNKNYSMDSLFLSFLVMLSVTGLVSGNDVSRPCSKDKSICRLPAEPGPCLALFRRYHFDAKQGRCKVFIYGGCLGNGNNFLSLEECQASCQASHSICDLPKVVGPCRARFLRFFYNPRSGTCERFYYGGCGGNSNNFNSIQQCSQNCPCQRSSSSVCSLPKKPGPCRGSMRRYFHNAFSRKCELFIYGGCGGNANNFHSIKDCQNSCPYSVQDKSNEHTGSVSNVCLLPKQVGPCRAAFRRFFYNKRTKKCEIFHYGGCDGNANNFVSIDKCRNKCIGQSASLNLCSLPKQTGPCRGSFRRYFFNKRTRTCERFIYGGCGGNANNFYSIHKCQSACNTY